MLAYAANAPRAARRTASPRALTLVVAGHAALIVAVLTAKPELIMTPQQVPTTVVNVREPPPKPVPETPVDRKTPQPANQPSFIDAAPPMVDVDQATPFEVDRGPTIADIGTVIGSGPTQLDPPRHVPVKLAPRFATPGHAVKPPYPLDKRRDGEEASLKLRLIIDERGRVTAVEPVGPADPAFLNAARRHIIRAWRYKPATEDGAAVPSSTMISLAFRLEDV